MKILIVSDTHGYNENLVRAIEIEKPFDKMIHLGDFEDEQNIRRLVNCGIIMVPGNNDYSIELDKSRVVKIHDYTVFITHGNIYAVNYGYNRVVYAGMEKGANIVMFGHTHVPIIDEFDGVTVINPGSLTYPRQEGRKPTYVVMNVDDNGLAHFELRELN